MIQFTWTIYMGRRQKGNFLWACPTTWRLLSPTHSRLGWWHPPPLIGHAYLFWGRLLRCFLGYHETRHRWNPAVHGLRLRGVDQRARGTAPYLQACQGLSLAARLLFQLIGCTINLWLADNSCYHPIIYIMKKKTHKSNNLWRPSLQNIKQKYKR